MGSDDALPSGDSYETRVHFDVDYAEGYPIGIALADDGSFVVMLHGVAPGDEYHGTHLLRYDADGNLLDTFWDPTTAQSYRLKSANSASFFLSREGSFQSDAPPGDKHENVTLTELSAQGTLAVKAVYPCHLDHCRLTYEPAADAAWTLTEADGVVEAQRWNLVGEPQGPAVTVPGVSDTFYLGELHTTDAGGLVLTTKDDEAKTLTAMSFDPEGVLMWSAVIDVSAVDECYPRMTDELVLLKCLKSVEGAGWQQFRMSIDAHGSATPPVEWPSHRATFVGPDDSYLAFDPGVLTIYDVSGAVLETGPGPIAEPQRGYSDVSGRRIAIISSVPGSDTGYVARVVVIELE